MTFALNYKDQLNKELMIINDSEKEKDGEGG